MLKKLLGKFNLLIESSRQVLVFELAYKLSACAVLYPILVLLINVTMKVAGIRYLTNEYVRLAFTNPVVIAFLFVLVVFFVFYCTFEMAFLSVCFENKRQGNNASIIDNVYNAYIRIKKTLRIKYIPIFIFYLTSILSVNLAVVYNTFYSQTIHNLIKKYVLSDKKLVFAIIAVMALVILFSVLGIFVVNIFLLEKKGYRESFAKSIRLVKNNFLRVILTLVVYNIIICLLIFLVYVVISTCLIVGVKILDMAYLGNAVYLSVLRSIRTIMKMVVVAIAIPFSFSAITQTYYMISDEADIDFEFIDIREGSQKRNKIIYLAILVASVMCNLFYVIMAFNSNPFEKVAIFHETQITAHRGASLYAPENTMAAFSKAIEDMADYVEIDVQMTKDSRLVIMHDKSAKRTTGVDKAISDMTFSEVRRLDAGSWFSQEFEGEKVPTLDEVLKLCKGKTKLNIELKHSGTNREAVSKTINTLEKYGMIDDVVITSVNIAALKMAKTFNENITVGYILSSAYGDFYNMEDVDFFSINAAFLSKRTVDAIHNSGKQVHAWTVNNHTAIKNLTNKGVDNIITDDPVVARETIYSRDTSETLINMLNYVFNR